MCGKEISSKRNNVVRFSVKKQLEKVSQKCLQFWMSGNVDFVVVLQFILKKAREKKSERNEKKKPIPFASSSIFLCKHVLTTIMILIPRKTLQTDLMF